MVLRAIEQKIEALFEGVFGRAFRTNVQPVELARKLAKEMDDHRTVSVSRVYVPNEYTVYLSADDRAQFEGYESSLISELAEYLSEHAQRESYALLTPPNVLLETDDDLAVGEFGIATRMVQPRRGRSADGAPEEQVEPGATMIYKPAAPVQATEAASAADLGVERELVTLSYDGKRHEARVRRGGVLVALQLDVVLRAPAEGQRRCVEIPLVPLGKRRALHHDDLPGLDVRGAVAEPGDRAGREHEALLREAQVACGRPHDAPDEQVEEDEEGDFEKEQRLLDRDRAWQGGHSVSRRKTSSVEPSVMRSPCRSFARFWRRPFTSIPLVESRSITQ